MKLKIRKALTISILFLSFGAGAYAGSDPNSGTTMAPNMDTPSSAHQFAKAAGDSPLGDTEVITGKVQDIEGNIYVIKDNQGKTRRLRIDPLVLHGADPKIGDMIKAKIETGGDIHQLIAAMEFEKVSESTSK